MIQELRIGNYVDVINRSSEVHLTYNTIKKVGCIEFFKVKLYEYDKPFATQSESWEVDSKDLSPILLTEECLLKLGFVKDKNDYRLEDLYSLSISVNRNGEFTPCFNDRILHSELKMKTLHQLQNLYFALTGKELEIKL